MTQVDVGGRRGSLMEKTQDKVGKLETQLEQWGAKLEELIAKADRAGTMARIDNRKCIDDLKATVQAAQLLFCRRSRPPRHARRPTSISGFEAKGVRQMDFSTSRADGVATLHIAGELDAVTAPDLRPSVDALLSEQPPRMVVDVSRLRLIDTLGVRALVSLYKKAKDYGGVVTVHGLCDQPLMIFKLLHLDRVLLA